MGFIENIDSLEQVIANMQAQIALLQDADNKLETRLFPFQLDLSLDDVFEINLLDITGYDLESAIIEVVGLDDYSCRAIIYCS